MWINSGLLRRLKYGLEVTATGRELENSLLFLALPVAGQFTYCVIALFPLHVK